MKKKKVNLVKAVGTGAKVVAGNVKKYIADKPKRDKAAHESKLIRLERQAKELELENKTLELKKKREKLLPPSMEFGFNKETSGKKKKRYDIFDSLF